MFPGNLSVKESSERSVQSVRGGRAAPLWDSSEIARIRSVTSEMPKSRAWPSKGRG